MNKYKTLEKENILDSFILQLIHKDGHRNGNVY